MLEENMRYWEKKVRKESEIEGMRKLLLRQIAQRFGRLPVRVRRQVEQVASTQELLTLAGKVLVAGSLEDLSLG